MAIRTSGESRQVNEEFKKVAAVIRRDSIDMRVIGMPTVVFLPDAFVSTILITDIFEFELDTKKISISPSRWVYWLFTLLLTFVVFLGRFLPQRWFK